MNSRKIERIELSQPISIVDTINGGAFGELINLTVEGLMALTDHQIPTHSIYQLELQLPMEIEGSKQIEIGADCLWCRPAENFHRYWAGFQIIDVSDQAMLQIEKLLEHYSK